VAAVIAVTGLAGILAVGILVGELLVRLGR
jgi:hypothetical protein